MTDPTLAEASEVTNIPLGVLRAIAEEGAVRLDDEGRIGLRALLGVVLVVECRSAGLRAEATAAVARKAALEASTATRRHLVVYLDDETDARMAWATPAALARGWTNAAAGGQVPGLHLVLAADTMLASLQRRLAEMRGERKAAPPGPDAMVLH